MGSLESCYSGCDLFSPGSLLGLYSQAHLRPTESESTFSQDIPQAIFWLIKVLEANFDLVQCFNNVKDPGHFFISFLLSSACFFFISVGFCLTVAR